MKAQIIFYSAGGHIYKMAKAIEQGIGDVEGSEVSLYRVPELGPDDSGAAKAGFGHVPIAQPERLVEADAIFFGTPTRYGNMCAPMRCFIDATASLWFSGRRTSRYLRLQPENSVRERHRNQLDGRLERQARRRRAASTKG